MGATPGRRGYIVEFQRMGNAVKASACDPETLLEVSIVGGARTPEYMLERTVIAKLERALGLGPRPKPAEGRGIVV